MSLLFVYILLQMQKNNNIFATEITKSVDSAKQFNQRAKDNLKLKFKKLTL